MLNLVLDAFSKVVAEVKEKNLARQKRLEAAWSEANDNLPPIVDSHGRLHAPCDGYHVPTQILDYVGCYDDVYFAKGQYLPIPLTGDDELDYSRFKSSERLANKYLPRDKIKVDESLADEVIAELENNYYISFTKGKSWEVNGNNVCYLYLSSPSQAMLNKFVKSIKSVIENTDKQVYTGEGIVGRQRVKGKVLRVFQEESLSYSYHSPINFVSKLLICLDNDSTCYGSLPNGVEVEVGDVVEFTATFQLSNKDPHHSYYKRPFKMEVLDSNA